MYIKVIKRGDLLYRFIISVIILTLFFVFFFHEREKKVYFLPKKNEINKAVDLKFDKEEISETGYAYDSKTKGSIIKNDTFRLLNFTNKFFDEVVFDSVHVDQSLLKDCNFWNGKISNSTISATYFEKTSFYKV